MKLFKNNLINIDTETRDGIIFALPWFIGFFAFVLYPFFKSFIYAFHKYDLLHEPEWVGLSNFVKLFGDSRFLNSLYNTGYYTVFVVPLQIALGLFVAVLLTQKVKGRRIFRSVFFLPYIVTGVAVAFVWKLMFHGDYGLINSLLALIGLDGPSWLASVKWSKPALILMQVWKIGMNMVIYIAAINDIPQELYEAAQIDGAGSWRKFKNITVPLVTPAIFYTLVINLTIALKFFTEVYALTGKPPLSAPGGPADSTLVYVLYLYEQGFTYLNMGYASLLAWILFIIILSLTLVQFRLSKRWVYYGS